MNLPNLITVGRIVLALLLVPLLFVDEFLPRLLGFVVFLVAAFSDLWDGHLARSRGLITDLGPGGRFDSSTWTGLSGKGQKDRFSGSIR